MVELKRRLREYQARQDARAAFGLPTEDAREAGDQGGNPMGTAASSPGETATASAGGLLPHPAPHPEEIPMQLGAGMWVRGPPAQWISTLSPEDRAAIFGQSTGQSEDP